MFKNRWTVIPRTFKQGAIPGVLVLLLLVLLTGGSPVFASTHTLQVHRPHRVVLGWITFIRSGPTRIVYKPAHALRSSTSYSKKAPGVTVQCLSESALAYSPADNQLDATAGTGNDCLSTVNGNQAVNIYNYCGGKGPNGYKSWPFKNLSVNFEQYNTGYFGVGCVVCENGVPVSYPPFSVTINVTASGSFTYHGRPYAASSDSAQDSTDISNNGSYAPPCPPAWSCLGFRHTEFAFCMPELPLGCAKLFLSIKLHLQITMRFVRIQFIMKGYLTLFARQFNQPI